MLDIDVVLAGGGDAEHVGTQGRSVDLSDLHDIVQEDLERATPQSIAESAGLYRQAAGSGSSAFGAASVALDASTHPSP